MKTTLIKKQHYVSQFYLKNWLSKRENQKDAIKVFNKNNNSKYLCTNLNSISQIRFFYEIGITQNVFDLIRSRYYDYALKNIVVKSLIEQLELDTLVELDKYQKNQKKDFEKTFCINKIFLENKYSKLEDILSNKINLINTDFNKYLDTIKNNSSESLVLIELFFIQLYRTKKMRENFNNRIQNIFVEKESIQKKLSNDEKDNFIKIMQFLDPIVESQKIIENNFTLELIKNNTKIKFITSNSPAVMKKISNNLMGFMALTPTIFFIISIDKIKSRKFNYREINDTEQIEYLNYIIYKNSDEIYTTI